MNGAVQSVSVGKGLMGEVVRFQVVPDKLDVSQFRRVVGEPFNGQPVRAGGERRA